VTKLGRFIKGEQLLDFDVKFQYPNFAAIFAIFSKSHREKKTVDLISG
jgi:hypothetical protein